MPSPSRQDVRARLLGLLVGSVTRDEAADWASMWIRPDSERVDDVVVWRALTQLVGADLLAEPGVYLHTEPDFHRWLDEFEEEEPPTTMTVWEMPCKSQEFNEGPRLRNGPSTLALAYDFETESGDYAWEEINFFGVAAFRFTAARYCTTEQIHAYDRLDTVPGSPWLGELADARTDLEHYRIFFDDVGCYEVLAGSFVPPPGS